MPLEELVAGVALLSVIAYAVFAGADFGGGVLDLCANGTRREEQRKAIAHAMGPVWEANHVWLIFVIVLLFTGFPPAYAALSTGLFTIFHLVLVGITLRGAAFVFRAYGPQTDRYSRQLGIVFGIASIITPVLLGMCLGAVSAGNLRVVNGQVQQGSGIVWLTPIAMVIGMLALAICTYLAAVYLTIETSGPLQADFRRRAIVAGTAVVAISVLTLPLLYIQAPHLWQSLFTLRAIPVLAGGGVAALLSGWALLVRRYYLARIASVAWVGLLLAGWGLAQHPYIIYPDVTLQNAAASPGMLRFVLVTLPIGLALLLPSLWLLFSIFKRDPVVHESG